MKLGLVIAGALLASPALARDQHAIDAEFNLCAQQSDFTLNTCMGRANDKNAEAACMNDEHWRSNVCLAIERLQEGR